MKIAVTGQPGEFYVWAMLDDDDFNHDPTTRGESFVIGSGRTPQEALTSATRELETAAGDVAVLAHDAEAGR